MTRIESYGWRGEVVPGTGRVVSAHGDYYHLVCNEAEGEIIARKKKSAFLGGDAVLPVTGDFVRFAHNPRGESMITEVLPRYSRFERKDPTARRKAQVLAVNFDTLFVMMSLNEDFSTSRIDRFLSLAEDRGGGDVVVAVTKADLREDGDDVLLGELEEVVAGRARILLMSALTGEGMAAAREYERPRETLALVGSSGVGKSTFLNTLAGEEWAAVGEVQEWSGKGRHTTTSRELVMLPSGAMVLDTPGVREIGFVGEADEIRAKGVYTHRWR